MTFAKKLNPSRVTQEIGTVRRLDGGELIVTSESGELRCRRATSCLVAPQIADSVLVATSETGCAWVLAVLDRADETQTRLELDGDVTFKTETLTLAGRAVSVLSGRFDVNAIDGNVALQRLTFVGRFVQSEVERIKSVASSFDGVFERFSQRVKRSYRKVEELEQLQARQLDYDVDKTLTMRGGNTILSADKLVKVDGDQIHLG